MDLSITQDMVKNDNIRNHCHVNSNQEGDRFVGIKADSDNAMVYFPLGYDMPDTDAEIRADIKHLIQVLAEFTDKEERLLAANRFAETEKVGLPINAYKSVIEYYFSIGGKYYVETEPTYRSSTRGNLVWPKTIRKKMPLVQQKNGISSFVYTDFIVRSVTPNDKKLITQINRYCVYEAFKKIGWMYVSYMPEEPGEHPDIKASIAIVRDKLARTNDDKKKMLFQGMKDMLEYMDERTSEKEFYFGVGDFAHAWERLVDRAFGEKNKEKYFPRTRWILDHGRISEQKPLVPDSIMVYNGKYYVLDAKFYKYGYTGRPSDLPESSSINKQLTYGEYVERMTGADNDSLFNAFIMPFNKAENCFKIDSWVGNIGEATGDWKSSEKNYERIQGIVMDTRYLMYHYAGNPMKGKAALAECIEAGLKQRMTGEKSNV